MFMTLPSDRSHFPHRARLQGESHWESMTLPPDTGVFLVDLDWSETASPRTQSLLYPATVAAVVGMYTHELAIIDIMFIPAPRHDGAGREPVLRVNAIDVARDPAQRFAQVLLVRTVDGHWHACDRGVNFGTLEDRLEMLRVDADPSDGMVPSTLIAAAGTSGNGDKYEADKAGVSVRDTPRWGP